MSTPNKGSDTKSAPPRVTSAEKNKYLSLRALDDARTPDQDKIFEELDAKITAEKKYRKSQGGGLLTIFAKEIAGMAILVGFGCLVAVQAMLSRTIAGIQIGSLEVAIAFGLALLTAALTCPGGHFNPAVSIALYMQDEKRSPLQLVIRIAGQHIGAAVGVGVILVVIGTDGFRAGLGATRLSPVIGFVGGLLLETILVTVLVVAVGRLGDKPYAPLGAGAVLLSGVLVGGTVTGGSLNWARTFGPDLLSWNFTDWPLYVLATLIGGVLGGLVLKHSK